MNKRSIDFENGFKIIFNDENTRIEDKAERELCEEGVFTVCTIIDALEFYLHKDIKESINCSNPIVRMFAVMDNQPEWLRGFYKLRINKNEFL